MANTNYVTIKEITSDHILFSDGSEITDFHHADCCEDNYADYEQLDDIARQTKFTLPLSFEAIEGAGFRFGNKPSKMFFVPCYSEQNGYYSSDINIYLNGKKVLYIEDCEGIYR